MDKDHKNSGYGCFVMFVAGVALFIALIAHRKWDAPLCGISTTDFNVVDILSILVTVLIAGQLWQSFVTKEDLKKIDEAREDVQCLKIELEQARELPQGIHWSLLGVREQSSGDTQGNRLAIQYYAESLKHLAKAQADYATYIRSSLVGIRICMENLINSNNFAQLSNEIMENIIVAEQAISQMSQNLREAFHEIELMRNTHAEAMRQTNTTSNPIHDRQG